MPTASVIIPTYNGRDYLQDCLASLHKQTRRDFELIIVDNGSTDGTAAAARQAWPDAHVIEAGRNLGYAGGMNLGAARASGEWLVLLNNDTVLEPDWLAQLLAAGQRDPTIGVCSSKVRLLSDRRRLDSFASYLTPCGFLQHRGLLEVDEGQYDGVEDFFSPKGVAFAIRRDLFEAIGVFDPTYFSYFEETDLFWQVWLRGYRIRFAPHALAYHKVGGTAARMSYAFVDYHSFKNRIRTIIKNAGAGTLCWMLPYHLVCCAGLVAIHALRPQRWGNGWAIVKAIGWNLTHLADTWRARSRVQRARRISDRALFRQAMRPIAIRDFARYTWWMVWVREQRRAAIHAGTL